VPAQTGIHAIDAEARALQAAAAGVPAARRGPAPRRRRIPRADALASTLPPVPGEAMVALAQFLHDHVRQGALTRRLHAAAL
jgi:hypothetical protein